VSANETHRPVATPNIFQDYITLTKPGVNKLLVLTTFCTMFVAAKGFPDLWLLLWTVMGLTLATSSAQAFNMVYDRDIDALMERTRDRPLPNGRVSVRGAMIWSAFLGILSVAVIVVMIPDPRDGGVNWWMLAVTAFGHLFYAIGYTVLLKRTTIHNVLIGGAAGAMPPLVGWTAVTGDLDPAAWGLFAIIFLWQCPHTWALAIWRDLDYSKVGVPMLPVVRGRQETKRQSLTYICLLVVTAVAFTFLNGMGTVYLIVATLAGLRYIQLGVQALYEAEEELWGKKLFFFSITWLCLIFLALPLDVLIHQPVRFDIAMRAEWVEAVLP